jgi:hypothetical protein
LIDTACSILGETRSSHPLPESGDDPFAVWPAFLQQLQDAGTFYPDFLRQIRPVDVSPTELHQIQKPMLFRRPEQSAILVRYLQGTLVSAEDGDGKPVPLIPWYVLDEGKVGVLLLSSNRTAVESQKGDCPYIRIPVTEKLKQAAGVDAVPGASVYLVPFTAWLRISVA